MGTLQNLRTILRCTAIISLKVSFKFLLKIILSRCDESWITAKSFIGRISNYTYNVYIFFFFIFNLNFEGTGYSSMATCFATNSLHFVLKLIVVVFTVFFLYRFPSFDRKQHLRNCGKKNPQKDKLLSTLSVTLGFSLIFFVTRLSP